MCQCMSIILELSFVYVSFIACFEWDTCIYIVNFYVYLSYIMLYIDIHMYLCTYIFNFFVDCIHMCLHIHIYVYKNIRIRVCIHIYMYIYICVHIYVCKKICMYICVYSHISKKIHQVYSSLNPDLIIWDKTGRKKGG